MTGYAMLWIGGGNDLVATQFRVSLNAVTYFLRVAVFVAPVIAFIVTKRICIGLQRADQERLLHGAETGVIERDPSGSYSERHAPISEGEAYTLTQHKQLPALLPAQDGDVKAKEMRLEQLRRRATRFYFIDDLRKPTRAELDEAAHHGSGDDHALTDGHDGNGNGHHSITSGTQQNVVNQ